jgi:tetratricopeptide (TPR) repeat protein/tRNA A-37 threonylcarbamoyl transferase component Bud32
MTRPADDSIPDATLRPEADSEEHDQHATLANSSVAGNEERSSDGTLALSDGLPSSVEPDHTCRLDEPDTAPDTCRVPSESVDQSTVQPSLARTHQPHAVDQTLPLPGEAPRPTTPARPPDRTEFVTGTEPRRGESVIDQTLNEPSQSGASIADAPTRPAPGRRHPVQDHDTSPLTEGGEHTAIPMTRHGEDHHRPDSPTLMPTTEPILVDERIRLPSIPGYKVLGELGRGGMGVVYKARQLKLGRIVALKMIRSGTQAGNEDLRRFRAEAEAVAKLQHANIVQIYEIGEHEGLPFFSLEFIDGGSLYQLLNKDSGMPARQAAELVELLSRAMDYAHKQGIVHRDLKPANILMAAAVPKITDFGLAKKLEEKDTGHTREGSILGTPSYMAPEQAAGKNKDIGPGADIYALGAILYDLLASRPPFRGETVMDTLQQVIHAEPLPPRRLQPRCPRDLEIICLRCLEKDPRKRYPTAGELADDLRRFLNNEPIQARATPWWEKTVKWARRRPAVACLLLTLFLLFAGLIGGSMYYAAVQKENARVKEEEAKREREFAQREAALAKAERSAREDADQQRGRADRRAHDALLAVDTLLTQIADQQLDRIPQLQGLRKTILSNALRFLNRFYNENRSDRLLREQLAFAQRRVGFINEMLGNSDEAVIAYSAALELSSELIKDEPDNIEHRRNTGIIAEKLAIVQQARREFDQAEKHFNLAVATLTEARKHYPAHVTSGAWFSNSVVASFQPANLRWNSLAGIVAVNTWRNEAAAAIYSLGDAHLHRGNFRLSRADKRAMEDFSEAIAQYDVLHRADPQNTDYQWRLAVAHGSLGNRSVASLDRAIALLEEIQGSSNRNLAYRADLANFLRNRSAFRFLGTEDKQEREKAVAEVSRAITLLRALTRENPSVVEYGEQLATCCSNLGFCWRELGKPAESVKAWKDAESALASLPLAVRSSLAVRQKRALFLAEQAKMLYQPPLRNFEDAVTAWQDSIDLLTELVKEMPASRELWTLLTKQHDDRLTIAKQFGRVAEAEKFAAQYVAALTARREQFKQPEDTRALAGMLHEWALLLRERGRSDDSDRQLKRAIDLQRELVAAGDNPQDRRRLCIYLLAVPDVDAVAACVKEWEEKGKAPALHEAAWCLAGCVPLTKDATKADALAREVVRLLQKAISLGFRDAKFLGKKEFDPLRMRQDFKGIVLK